MVDDLWLYCPCLRVLYVYPRSRLDWYCDCCLNIAGRILNKTKELIFCMDPKTQKERDEVVKRKYIYKPVLIIFGILNVLIIALFVMSL